MAETCTVVRFSKELSLVQIASLKHRQESADRLGEPQLFSGCYVICIALSIVTYILDVALAVILLYFYMAKGYGVYFALTLSFTILPAIFMTAFSMRWYIVDHDDPSLGKTTVPQWIIRIIFLLLQLSPLLRYIDTLVYGIRSRIAAASEIDQLQNTLYRRMLDEDSNGALLRLFHCFLHSAPQAVIQLMILLTHVVHKDVEESLGPEVAVLQAWAVLVALMSLAWALTSYHRSVRYARDDKEKIACTGLVVGFCWHFMSGVSRVLALSLLASILPTWMGVLCGLHWGMMSTWLALSQNQTTACSNRCEELLLSTALGYAYVFAFISPRDGPTRYIYLAYYLVCFMENIGTLVVWCVATNSEDNPLLYYGATATQVLTFAMALALMLSYYRCFHPSTSSHSKTTEIVDTNVFDIDKPGYSKARPHHPLGS